LVNPSSKFFVAPVSKKRLPASSDDLAVLRALPVRRRPRPLHMARKSYVGEMVLGGIVIALMSFVGSQVIASPRSHVARGRVLSGRDSAAIALQYRKEIAARRFAWEMPAWLETVEIGRLQAAAQRDVDGRDSVPPMSPDSVQAVLAAAAQSGTYLATMLAQDSGVVTRWHASDQPIRVWVQPQSSARGFSPEMIGPARRAFTAWNEVGLPVTFAMVDDSTEADVHVTWTDRMPGMTQIGTTYRMTGGRGWIAFAHVMLKTTYDIYTVQNAARHEAGHVLGLGHSPTMQDIMAAETEGRQYQLTDADRGTALALYQLRPGKVR
jgi:predicted Zn-dependent protease